MSKRFFLLSFCLTFFFFLNPAFSHVSHYKNLNKLEFDLYRNDVFIGKHTYLFKREGQRLLVQSNINFVVKKLGISLYKYNAESEENYNDGNFLSFSSLTNQNKKKKFVKIYTKNNIFFIEGSSYTGKAPKDFVVGTWWNHLIINTKNQISAVSGRIIKQKVKFLGKETIIINNDKYNALKFNFSSIENDPKKKKKLDTNVWYDEKSLIWLKASFDRMGKWEYRLKAVE